MGQGTEKKAKALTEKYQANLSAGMGCAEAALQAIRELICPQMPEENVALARAFAEGSYVGDRCGIFAASIMTIGLLYGRKLPNFSYQYDRELVSRLYGRYIEEWNSCFHAQLQPCCAESAEKKFGWLIDVLAEAEAEGMEAWSMDKEKLKDKFMVHETLKPYADYIMDQEDWQMVALADQKRRIPQEELSAEILDREYRRAVINKRMVNGKPEYFLGGFPRRIDSCLRSERKLWDSLPEAARDAYIHFMQDYDIWVFPELKAGTWEKSRIVPIEVVLEELDATDDLIWLQDCDCRIYSKVRCEYPIDTCVHWGPSVLNTAYDRGYAVQLTKEEARANLIRSDEAGLIHCFNPGGGLCNCCVCCCWAFKSLHRLEENGYDAKKDFYDVPYIISLDAEKCVNCGLCTKKCQFGALKKGKTHIELDESACFGCGVCRVACRKDALVIKKRESK